MVGGWSFGKVGTYNLILWDLKQDGIPILIEEIRYLRPEFREGPQCTASNPTGDPYDCKRMCFDAVQHSKTINK